MPSSLKMQLSTNPVIDVILSGCGRSWYQGYVALRCIGGFRELPVIDRTQWNLGLAKVFNVLECSSLD